jgi:hypothetical protein
MNSDPNMTSETTSDEAEASVNDPSFQMVVGLIEKAIDEAAGELRNALRDVRQAGDGQEAADDARETGEADELNAQPDDGNSPPGEPEPGTAAYDLRHGIPCIHL